MELSKTCKLCDGKRYANLSLCYTHYKGRERAKKEEKLIRYLKRKCESKTFQKNEKKKWHRKTWKLMSEIVRKTGADFAGFVKCYTCPTKHYWKDLHAGHWKHGVLDFDPRNIKPQCPKCNLYYSGRLDIYTMNLVRNYGIEWVTELDNDASKFTGYSLGDIKLIYLRLHKDLNE